MAENNENEPPILEPSVERGDFEDNESNNSFEFENAQDMSHMESELKQHMTEIATQVKNSITDMSNHMQQQFSDVSSRIERLESQVHENSKNITGEGSHRITSLDSINVNDNNKQPIPTSVLHIPEPMAETTVLEHSATSETTNNNIFLELQLQFRIQFPEVFQQLITSYYHVQMMSEIQIQLPI